MFKNEVISQNINLSLLSKVFPNINSCYSEIIYMNALLTLPVETIHIISDIHGEYSKLNHIMSNASGNIKIHAEKALKDLTAEQQIELINLVYYPENKIKKYKQGLFLKHNGDKQLIHNDFDDYIIFNIKNLIKLFHSLSDKYTNKWIDQFLPQDFKNIFNELLTKVNYKIEKKYIQKLVKIIADYKLGEYFIIKFSEIIKNIAVAKLIVLGDLGDRGPSIRNVIQVLKQKKNVDLIWGNHDIEWIGAAAGSESLICNVIRVSLKYGNIDQLEKDYSISLNPLRTLVEKCYSDDPALNFKIKQNNLTPEETLLYAKMHKAITILQLKLEDALIKRNNNFNMNSRLFKNSLDVSNKKAVINGKEYDLIDDYFPTIRNENDFELTADEKDCILKLKQEFLFSKQLKDDMEYLISNGKLYHTDYDFLMYHGCVPVKENKEFASLIIDDITLSGKNLFDAIESKIFNIFDDNTLQKDLDLLWYLWCGTYSPVFGKDKMATFERYFVKDETTHKETKNPYYKLIEDKEFCKSILKDFNICPEKGTIVSGHTVIETEKGNSPIKADGKSLIIDGGFAAAYGDKGYTLILASHGVYLAEHTSFVKIQEALEEGKDLIPNIITIKDYSHRLTLESTPKGNNIKESIKLLEKLVESYRKHQIKEQKH